jgi:hypothetical protein
MKKSLALIVLSLLLVTGCSSGYRFDKSETVGYTSLRLAIAQSAVDGTGEISKENMDKLKSAIKNQNKNNEWFSDYNDTFIGKTQDTSDNKIDLVCNSNYCAKITVKQNKTEYHLVDYSFFEKSDTDKGYKIYVK